MEPRLAFDDRALVDEAKTGVLIGSVIASVLCELIPARHVREGS